MKKFCFLSILILATGLSPSLLAVSSSGTVVGWGDIGALQLMGPRARGYSTGAVAIICEGLSNNAVAIATGPFHSLVLTIDGTVVGWGSNHGGQAIGSETSDQYHTNGLVRIGGHVLSNISSIAAGNGVSIGLRHDGTMVTWGKKIAPTTLNDIMAVAAGGIGSSCLALKSNGTVVAWGDARIQSLKRMQPPDILTNAVSISVGGADSMIRLAAIKKDGSVITWGNETTHHDATPPSDLKEVSAVSVGYNHTLALKKDGTVVGWGFNDGGQATGVPTKPGEYVSRGLVKIDGTILTNVTAIAAGREYSLALKSDGTVIAWGNKRFYRKVPDKLRNIIAIAAGEGFCLAITTNSVTDVKN